MATYSEEFLNALSRASSSVKGLMDTIKEPNWRDKLEYENELELKKEIALLRVGGQEERSSIQTTGTEQRKTVSHEDWLGYAKREHQLDLSITKEEFDTKMKSGLMELQSGLNIDEMKQGHRLEIKRMKKGSKLNQKENRQLSDLRLKEYDFQKDKDYEYEVGDNLFLWTGGAFGKEGVGSIEQGYAKDKMGIQQGYTMENIMTEAGNTERLATLESKLAITRDTSQHELDINRLITTSGLERGEAEFQHELWRDGQAMMDYLTRGQAGQEHGYNKELKNLDFGNQSDMAALKAIFDVNMENLQAENSLRYLDQQRLNRMEEAGYMASAGLMDVDFGSIDQPVERLFRGREGEGAINAKAQFHSMLSLYNLQMPGVLQAQVVDPNSYTVTEAISDAELAIAQAKNLLDYSEGQGFEEDADYYANAIQNLARHRDGLKNR